jgi:hypothetical protein
VTKVCNYYRDRDGFCHLLNSCWSGKPCPKTQRQADAAREALVRHFAALEYDWRRSTARYARKAKATP